MLTIPPSAWPSCYGQVYVRFCWCDDLRGGFAIMSDKSSFTSTSLSISSGSCSFSQHLGEIQRVQVPSSPSSPSPLGGSIVSAMSSAELFLQVRITSPAEKTMPAIEMVTAKILYKSAKRLTFFTCGVSRCWPWPCALPRHWMLKS